MAPATEPGTVLSFHRPSAWSHKSLVGYPVCSPRRIPTLSPDRRTHPRLLVVCVCSTYRHLFFVVLPAALLRELVKEMPADKRLSFQTRVANARSKEAIEGLLDDYSERLECLVLPHARSREIDLQQVKKVRPVSRIDPLVDGSVTAVTYMWTPSL